MQENREKVLKKNIVGVSWHQEFYQGNKRTRVLYKAFAPSGRVGQAERVQPKYTLHLKRLQFFFCQSSYLHDLRPRHSYCQQVTGYCQTFR